MVVAAVAGNGINEQIADMKLHLRLPNNVSWNDYRDSCHIIANLLCQMVSHLAWIAAFPDLSDLHLAEQPVSLWRTRAIHRQLEIQPKHIAGQFSRVKRGKAVRERSERLRLWNPLIAENGEAVIGRDEEIVAADVVLVQERWTMGVNDHSK